MEKCTENSVDDGDGPVSLEWVRSVYVRTMDDRLLPEIEAEPPNSLTRQGCRALHDQLMTWLEITPALVINKSGHAPRVTPRNHPRRSSSLPQASEFRKH